MSCSSTADGSPAIAATSPATDSAVRSAAARRSDSARRSKHLHLHERAKPDDRGHHGGDDERESGSKGHGAGRNRHTGAFGRTRAHGQVASPEEIPADRAEFHLILPPDPGTPFVTREPVAGDDTRSRRQPPRWRRNRSCRGGRPQREARPMRTTALITPAAVDPGVRALAARVDERVPGDAWAQPHRRPSPPLVAPRRRDVRQGARVARPGRAPAAHHRRDRTSAGNVRAPAGPREKRRMIDDATVQAALNRIRPFLQRDGGDIELVSVADNRARVRLTGNCAGCPSAAVTLYLGRGELPPGGDPRVGGDPGGVGGIRLPFTPRTCSPLPAP